MAITLNLGENSSSKGKEGNWVKPTVYANIILPATTEEGKSITISLPYGVGLDTMRESEEEGTEAWVDLKKAENAFLKYLLSLSNEVEAGEGTIVPEARVEIRRVKPKNTKPSTENSYFKAISDKVTSLTTIVDEE